MLQIFINHTHFHSPLCPEHNTQNDLIFLKQTSSSIAHTITSNNNEVFLRPEKSNNSSNSFLISTLFFLSFSSSSFTHIHGRTKHWLIVVDTSEGMSRKISTMHVSMCSRDVMMSLWKFHDFISVQYCRALLLSFRTEKYTLVVLVMKCYWMNEKKKTHRHFQLFVV